MYVEHIDNNGNLKVPVNNRFTQAPNRDGWKPFWVNVNMDRDPIKIFTYRPNGTN